MAFRNTYVRVALWSLAISLTIVPPLTAQITVKYDRFRDFTFVTLELAELEMSWPRDWYGKGTGVEFGAFFGCPGSEICEPDTVRLRFVSRSESDWRFATLHHLIILADTTRLDLGDLDYSSHITTYEMVEFMTAIVPLETLEVIAHAEHLEGKLGIAEFELSYDQRAGLRELLERMSR